MRIAVIGSGPVGLGCLFGILQFLHERRGRLPGPLSVSVYLDSRRDLRFYKDSQQINRYLGHGGTSRYWHAVTATSRDMERDYLQLLTAVFGVSPARMARLQVADHSIFVPLFRPDFFGLFMTALARIAAALPVRSAIHAHDEYVTAIDKRCDDYVVTSCTGRAMLCDVLFLACNIVDATAICPAEFVPPYELYDHVQVLAGIVDRRDVLDPLLLKPTVTASGYVLPVHRSPTSMVMLRPCHSGWRELQKRNFQNFGKKAADILVDIAKNPSLARVREAAATRFGCLYGATRYSVWVQTRVRVEANDGTIVTAGRPATEAVDDVGPIVDARHFVPLSGHRVPGNHTVGESADAAAATGRLQILNLKPRHWLSGEHHTLLSVLEAKRRTLACINAVVDAR